MTIKTTPNPITIPRASISISREDNTKSQLTSSTKAIINHPAILPKSILKKSDNQQEAQNKTETSPKKVHFSDTTTEKTVHLKEVKQLKDLVSSNISRIQGSINKIMSGHVLYRSSNSITSLNKDLLLLKTEIKSYQDKLDSSSYQHHQSKQSTLTKLGSEIDSLQSQINFAGKKMNLDNNNHDKIHQNKQNSVNQAVRQNDYKEYGHK